MKPKFQLFYGIQRRDRSTPTRKRDHKPKRFTFFAAKCSRNFSFLVYHSRNNRNFRKSLSYKIIPCASTVQTIKCRDILRLDPFLLPGKIFTRKRKKKKTSSQKRRIIRSGNEHFKIVIRISEIVSEVKNRVQVFT